MPSRPLGTHSELKLYADATNENEREYEITQEHATAFEAALVDAERGQSRSDALIQRTIIESFARQLGTLKRELRAHEREIAHPQEPIGAPEVLLGPNDQALCHAGYAGGSYD